MFHNKERGGEIINIVKEINENKLVSIIRSSELNEENIIPILDALEKGGIKIVEITLNSNNALEIIKLAVENKNNMIIGAGTVKNLEDAKKAIDAGSQFLLMPNLDVDVIKYCVTENILVIPGVYSPTEIYTAIRNGAEILKLFPISCLPDDYIKSVSGPFGKINFMGVGGISSNNAKKYIRLGCTSFGIGSSIVDDVLIRNRDYGEINSRAKKLVQSII